MSLDQRTLANKLRRIRHVLNPHGCQDHCSVCGLSVKRDSPCPVCGGDETRATDLLQQVQEILTSSLTVPDQFKALNDLLFPQDNPDRCRFCHGSFDPISLFCVCCGDRSKNLLNKHRYLLSELEQNRCRSFRIVGKKVWRWTCWNCGTAQGNETTHNVYGVPCSKCGKKNMVMIFG